MNELGIKDIMELFSDIPRELILNRDLKVGFGRMLTEYEVKRLFRKFMSKNKVFNNPPSFIGGGFCLHSRFLPRPLSSQVLRCS